MQVILLKDVPKVGKRTDVKNVSDGYALNFLIPQGLAERATEGKIATLTEAREKQHDAASRESASRIEEIRGLDGVVIELTLPANEQGHLYEKLDAKKIAAIISDARKINISGDAIQLPEPIKETGTHSITLSIEDVTAHCTLQIAAQ